MSEFECKHCGRVYDYAADCTSDDCPRHGVKMPELFEHWTVDEVAECIDGVGDELYRKLWSFITPETDGKKAPLAKIAWDTFTMEEREHLAAAVAKEYPED